MDKDFEKKVKNKKMHKMMAFAIIAAIIALGAASLAAFEASSIYKGYADNNVDSEYVPKKKRSLPSALLGSMFSPFFLLLVVMFIVMTLIP